MNGVLGGEGDLRSEALETSGAEQFDRVETGVGDVIEEPEAARVGSGKVIGAV
jgi:hypothetical protein